MQHFGPRHGPGSGQPSSPGLVLLFAESYRALPPALVLDRPVVSIGREDADVVLPVPAVSRRHAQVRFDGHSWILSDLNSTNGTLVDGRRVMETILENAHEVRIGDAIFKFVESEAEEYARYRIDGSVSNGARFSRHETSLVGGYRIDRLVAQLERIAKTELSVMLLGESGTGKEVVARELHRLSGRTGRFCAVNCAALPATLIESELFGYKRGAFSGAARDKAGLFQSADGGTVFLDEIGDMPLEAQAKLLRVLQSKEVLALGSTMPEKVDVRIVCATHRDLIKLQTAGDFRADLFARLNEFKLELLPLRERKEDVFLLTRAFLARHGRPDLGVSFAFMTGLLNYDWPYNVRELEATVKRSIALADSNVLDVDQLPDSVRDAMQGYATFEGQDADLPAQVGPHHTPVKAIGGEAPSSDVLRQLLSQHQGNVAAVGRELGKARMQIHRWMKRYGIDVEDFRAPD